MSFFRNFFISQPVKLKFGTGTQNWVLILILGSKSGFGMISDNITIILRHLFGQMPLRNSVAMATLKILGDQKLFERVCYTLKLKVTKFQFPRPNGFRAILRKPAGGQIFPPPVQNRVKLNGDFNYASTRIKLHSLRALKRYLNDKNLTHGPKTAAI